MPATAHAIPEDTMPTRERICAVAASLFADRGFAGVSMRDIADGVGIKAASLYNHFDDKEQLYIAALTQGFSGRIEKIDAAIDTDGSTEDRLRATVNALARVSAEDDVSRKLLHRELLDGDSKRLDQLSGAVFKPAFDRMTGLFTELSSASATPDGDSARTTAYINALITGYFVLLPVLRSLDTGLPTDADAIGDQIADMLIDSLKRGIV